ncbi:FecR domain-containing protein, partial [Chitinophaga sp.]|uniref:FecR domain-containing protein n=1 Tax=Chitinophaga sp. TaxID=1869181 RepID=UPI002F930A7B
LEGDTWFEVALPVRARMQLDEHTDLYTLNAVFTVHKTNTIFKILVIKGKVTLVQDKGKKVYLTASMLAKREQHQPLQFKTVKGQSLLAWKTGRLSFRNTPLEEVIDAVNSYFQLNIQVPPSAASLYKRSLTVDFENKSADETLVLLQRALNVPLVKDSGNRYYITLK